MTITVLIADDAAMVRAGFAALLDAQEDLRVVGQVSDGKEAVAQAARLRPDVILMDVRMPEMNGIEATERIGAPSFPASPPPRILMLTTFDIDDYVHDALQAGASGFLLKDATPEELVHAVRVVAAGDALLSPGITRRMIAQFAARRPARPVTAPCSPCSPTASGRCCCWSPRDARTARWARSCSSPTTPSRRTWAVC